MANLWDVLFKGKEKEIVEDRLKETAAQTALQTAAQSFPGYSRPVPFGANFQGLEAQGRAMQPNVLDQVIAANSGPQPRMPSVMPGVDIPIDLGKVVVNPNQRKNILGQIGDTVRTEGYQGTDKAPKGFGNDLYKFIQSIGYGMLDKPLGRDASTWDYLGKTVGQIARMNEGSGLGAGQQIYEQPQEKLQQAAQLAQVKGENRLPSYAQSQEQLATVAALRSGKYALKGDFTGELARQDIKTFDDALTYVTYKGINPNDPTILEALKKYPVTKNGKVVGKFAGFDTDGEILVE